MGDALRNLPEDDARARATLQGLYSDLAEFQDGPLATVRAAAIQAGKPEPVTTREMLLRPISKKKAASPSKDAYVRRISFFFQRKMSARRLEAAKARGQAQEDEVVLVGYSPQKRRRVAGEV